VSGSEAKRGVFYGRGVQLGIQIYAIVVVAGWSFVMSGIILLILSKTMGVRVSGTCKPCSQLHHVVCVQLQEWCLSQIPASVILQDLKCVAFELAGPKKQQRSDFSRSK
jgi:hypothetical protein